MPAERATPIVSGIDADPYAARRERRQSGEEIPVPQHITRLFNHALRNAVIGCALSRKRPRDHVERFMKEVEGTPFHLDIRGRDAIWDSDIVLSTHQGPDSGVDGDENEDAHAGIGGTEGLYLHAMLRPDSVYVLKESLLRRFVLKSPWNALKQFFMAQAFRKTHPIPVKRLKKPPHTDRGAPEPDAAADGISGKLAFWKKEPVDRRLYVKKMREERNRVGTELCRVVNEDGKQVVVLPEGTRSTKGNLLGFVSEFFQTIVTDYILPRLDDGRPVNIGIVATDVLSAFPDGVGKDVKAYRHPITIRGIRYDGGDVIAELRKRTERLDSPPLSKAEIKSYGRRLLMDVRKRMAEELECILAGDNSPESHTS